MCTTPYCFGDCEDCIEDKKREKKERDNETCQFSNGKVLESQCGLFTVSVKQDSCSKCGYTVNY